MQTTIALRGLNKANTSERDQILQQVCQRGLSVLNAEIRVLTPPPSLNGGRLVVANHISWMDIFTITALMPSAFIAMKEIASWPFLGKIIANIGTVFIDRSNRRDVDPINTAISEKLKKEQNVCFFPEARTSLGNGVLPLKAALFESAINARAAIQPIALRYYDTHGNRTETVSFANINLIQSLWRIVSLKKIRIDVDFAAPIWPQSQPEADRFILKDQVENFLKHKVLEDSPNPERLLP